MMIISMNDHDLWFLWRNVVETWACTSARAGAGRSPNARRLHSGGKTLIIFIFFIIVAIFFFIIVVIIVVIFIISIIIYSSSPSFLSFPIPQLCSKPPHTKTRDDLPSPSEFNFEILNPIHLQIFNNTLNIVLTSLLNSFFAKHFFTEHLITEWYSSKQPVSAAPQGSQPVLHGKPYFVSQYQLYHIVNFILSASIIW